jgi:hypothetical protein
MRSDSFLIGWRTPQPIDLIDRSTNAPQIARNALPRKDKYYLTGIEKPS